MTEHPGEQFPPDVDPDVEPGFDPYPSEDTPETPDYDAEPAPQNFSHEQPYGGQAADETDGGSAGQSDGEVYGEGGELDAEPAFGASADEAEVDAEAAFEASLDEPASAEAQSEQAEESAAEHVDPAEVEFGPEFARAPGQEHEHSYAAAAAVTEHEPTEESSPEDPVAEAEREPAEDAVHADVVAEQPGEDGVHAEVVAEQPAEVAASEDLAEVTGDAESVADGADYDPADDVVPDEAGAEADYAQTDEGAHPLVEETMGRLGELRDRPVAEHAEVYADLHERLQSALVEADADSGDRG